MMAQVQLADGQATFDWLEADLKMAVYLSLDWSTRQEAELY